MWTGDLDTWQMGAQPTCMHENKDVLGGQHPGESSHNFFGKSAHLGASLKFPTFSNPSSVRPVGMSGARETFSVKQNQVREHLNRPDMLKSMGLDSCTPKC